MAEIKIQKKQNVWPWIALLAGILALLYYLFVYDKGDKVIVDKEVTVIENTNEMSESANDKVTEYNAFISDDASMGVDHEFSNMALMKLIDATDEVANTLGVDIKADLDMARKNAGDITEDPAKLNHADKIKSAGTVIVQALKKIQSEKFPALDNDAKGVQMALDKINPAVATLDQKDAVKGFFSQSGQLLTNMKNK